ncbi:MAG: hypothetical protein KDC66_00455 [Phaeodactylibacter sp.]|nr:hypothetical protein [Phaeodactylibacter sp.]MCB9273830.1 hypothetical protein [Lewinellaceae bacterium]
MKKHCNTLFAAAILANLLAGSCSPTLYIPNMINTPLLGEKGDFRAAIGGTGMAPEASFDLQGSYALSDQLAVMASGSLMGQRQQQEWSGFRQDLVEAGLGTYKAFWPNRNGFNRGRAEVFAGAGAAWSEDRSVYDINNGYNNYDTYRSNYQRLFLQPGFGIRTRVLDAAITTRLAWVNFSDYQHRRGGEAIEKSRFGFATVEPVLTLGLGYKYVKVFLQIGTVNPFLNPDNYDRVTGAYLDGHFNGGLSFTPWREQKASGPAVAMLPPAPQQETALPTPQPQDNIPTTAADIRQPTDSTVLPPLPMPDSPPAMALSLDSKTATVCIRDNGFPDGDIISVSYRGAYLLRDAELQKTPQCLELHLWQGERNTLYIHSISAGRVKPNTVLVTVADGKEEKRFILQLEEGKTEQIDFSVK